MTINASWLQRGKFYMVLIASPILPHITFIKKEMFVKKSKGEMRRRDTGTSGFLSHKLTRIGVIIKIQTIIRLEDT